ncbi:hypothetical protein BDR22DRAFT_891980 [Usnea florida]
MAAPQAFTPTIPSTTAPVAGALSPNPSPSSASSALSISNQNSTSHTTILPRTTVRQVSLTSTIFPSTSDTTSSSSHAPSKTTTLQSTGTHQGSSATSSTHSPVPAPSDRLSNGAVAGIAVGAALGLALLTFLATFLIMRRKRDAIRKRQSTSPKDRGEMELSAPRQQNLATMAKQPFTTEAPAASGTYEDYLPQSADDRTVQGKAKATLDQIELHVENFYRNASSSAIRPDNAELAGFDSPYLPAALASLLPRSKNRVNIIKHALTQCIVASISPTANPARSILPTEYALLPHTVTSARSSVSNKVGSAQIMSRWRVMTTYLLPDPTKDAAYVAQRDKQISNTVQSFARAFAPWKSTGYKDEERARSLSAILENAANLGIFLFSQPSTIKFHWPSPSEIGASRIVVAPALLKTTDEKGQDLAEAQVMVNQVVLDA